MAAPPARAAALAMKAEVQVRGQVPAAPSPPSTGWLDVAERGSVLGIWFMVAVCRLLGRRVGRLLVRPLVLYFVAFAPTARRASRAYLQRLGLPHGTRAVLAHCRRFANCTLDRLFWSLGETQRFEVTSTGSEHLRALAAERRGALLVGAHLGSFEAMRGMATRGALPLNIVGYFKNARLINGVLEKLNPGTKTRVLAVEPGVDFVLRLKERIEAGELVALLADRVGLGDRVVEAKLFGERVSLPAGPYWLAATLGCPVYLTFGLFHEPNRYHLYCEPFAERVVLPRGAREEGARGYAERFAARLEYYCRLAPDNWFNFYDFWRSPA
ncbi:MAG TPA: lipid A biosynthesis acyltransferase [Polyangia bacterium]|nr:lipid A biosynthesis acyltransferase [Polyangia bacterium]